jgi:hypothetical protein
VHPYTRPVPIDVCVVQTATGVRRTAPRVLRFAHTFISVAGVVAAVAGVGSLFAALGFDKLGREELVEPAANLMTSCLVVWAATLPGFRRTDLPRALARVVEGAVPERRWRPIARPRTPSTHGRIVQVVDSVVVRVEPYVEKLTGPVERQRHRLSRSLTGRWPFVVVAISIAMFVLAVVLPDGSAAATLGGVGCSVAVFSHLHRRGRPWIFLAVVATRSAVALGEGAPVQPFLTLLGAASLLVAVMVALLHIVELCSEGRPRRATAVVVGLTVGLLVIVGGPPLYDLVGLGTAGEAREGARAVAFSVLASALFVASFPDREADLRAERIRADDAEAALAEMRGRYDELRRGSAGPPTLAAGDNLRQIGAWFGVAPSNRRT